MTERKKHEKTDEDSEIKNDESEEILKKKLTKMKKNNRWYK
jgi:hypothetical protein